MSASRARTYIYVKFRCRRCKRMGQMFVPEDRWDWGFLEAARDELSDAERDRLARGRADFRSGNP